MLQKHTEKNSNLCPKCHRTAGERIDLSSNQQIGRQFLDPKMVPIVAVFASGDVDSTAVPAIERIPFSEDSHR